LASGCTDAQVLGGTSGGTGVECQADVDTQLSQEQVEDYVGALIGDGTGTHTGIAVTYQDATGDVDFVVTESDPAACTNGACTVGADDTITGFTASKCARFDGSGNLVAATGDCTAGDTDTTYSVTATSGLALTSNTISIDIDAATDFTTSNDIDPANDEVLVSDAGTEKRVLVGQLGIKVQEQNVGSMYCNTLDFSSAFASITNADDGAGNMECEITKSSSILSTSSILTQANMPAIIATDNETTCWGADSDVCFKYDEATDNRGEWTGATVAFEAGAVVPTGQDITLTDAPSAATDAANKDYVDDNDTVLIFFSDTNVAFGGGAYFPPNGSYGVNDGPISAANLADVSVPAMTCTKIWLDSTSLSSTSGTVTVNICKNTTCGTLTATNTFTSAGAGEHQESTGTTSVSFSDGDDMAIEGVMSGTTGFFRVRGTIECDMD